MFSFYYICIDSKQKSEPIEIDNINQIMDLYQYEAEYQIRVAGNRTTNTYDVKEVVDLENETYNMNIDDLLNIDINANDTKIQKKNMDNTLEARGVVKRFAGHTALDGVSVEVRPGRVFGLLGPNGAGKTTLIRIINRITMPDEGEVMMGGRLMTDADVRRIGYLPEERGLYKKMKVGEQALYLAQLKGLDKATAEKRLRQWFDKFDINPWWNKKLEELSKGMQQKVQFVITVLHEPEFLIFDEPFSGFDPVNAELLKKEILELRDKGHTIIFSTHNMSSVEEICDDIALINDSHVVLSGTVGDVRSRYRSGLYSLVAESGRMLAENPEKYDITSIKQAGDNVTYTLRKTCDATNSEFIAMLSQQVEIRSFAEQLPTMNDIFLRAVGGVGNNDKEEQQ